MLTACGGGGMTVPDGGDAGGGDDQISFDDASDNMGSRQAISKSAVNSPKGGSVTQSSNSDGAVNPTTTDSVEVAVTYNSESGRLDYSATKTAGAGGGIGVTISSTSDSVLNRQSLEKAKEKGEDLASVELYKKLQEGRLWVDIYTNNEPDIDISSTPGGVMVSSGSMVQDAGITSHVAGGVSGLTGDFNDEAGTFSCSSSCSIINGIAMGDTWTFTPDSAAGDLVPLGSVLGSNLGVIDGRRVYSGNFNDQAGTFSCSPFETPSGCSFFNGRTNEGPWRFTPSSESVVTVTQDTDYLAGGIWVYVPDDASSLADYEFGAFIDGPDEFEFTQANLVGLTSTADYGGDDAEVIGVFADESTGKNIFFDADVHLTANFGTISELGTISGRIYDFENSADKSSFLGDSEFTLSVAMPETDSSSLFTGDTSMTFENEEYEGKWGAQFYGNGAVATDHPSSVAGTFGAATPGPNGKSLLGVFAAFKKLLSSRGGDAGGGEMPPPDGLASVNNELLTALATPAARTLMQTAADSNPLHGSVSQLSEGTRTFEVIPFIDNDGELSYKTERKRINQDTGAVFDYTRYYDSKFYTGLGSDTASTTRFAKDGAVRHVGLKYEYMGEQDEDQGVNETAYIDVFTDYDLTEAGDDTDYLVGGIWLWAPVSEIGSIQSNLTWIGVSASGNDPFGDENGMGIAAVTGTATYSGGARGLITEKEDGDTKPNKAFTADVVLTANFDTEMISGIVNHFTDAASVDLEAGVVTLVETSIGAANSGFFTGDTSVIDDDEEATSNTGKWGGQFYGNTMDNATAQPGSVAGTFGASVGDADNDNDAISILGVFGAYK